MELTIEQALQQGVAAQKEGNLQKAERLYRAILQSQPAHADANHNLGVIAVSVNKAELALPLFKTALGANPKREQFWLSYIDALIEKNQLETAKKVLTEGRKVGLAGDKVDAFEAQVKQIRQSALPKSSEEKKSLTLKETRKKVSESKQQKKQAESKSANDVSPSQSQINNLLEHYQSGVYGEAEKLAVSITRQFPEHPFGWKALGAVLNKIGRVSESLDAKQNAVELSPQDAEAQSNLGNTLQVLGRLEEAEASNRQAIVLKPDYAEAHNNLGITLKELGRIDEAEASYRQAIAFKPDYAEAYNNLGAMLHELGRFEEAEASYRQAIAFKSDFVEAHSNLGATLKELGRIDEAEASYRQAIVLKPDLSLAYSNLGNTITDLGRLDEAEASYRQAIVLESDFALAHYNLGMCLFETKQYDTALKEFELINMALSKSYAIKCSYLQDKESIFYEKLDSLINQGEANAIIGSVICCSEIKYGIKRSNPFCKEPLHYVVKTDLHEQYDFEEIFVKTARDVLADNSIAHKAQGLLTAGIQTAGNIFAVKKISETEIESIIRAEVEKYRISFKDSDEGFIRNWPTSYKIQGWFVSMQSGGKLAAHMHELGWISGSVYINVPVKSETDSGNLVLRLGEKEHALKIQNSQESIIDVETGSLCLFPSSLYHYTVPFEDKENRIVLAFDVIPTK
jgi:tetratricopeptide (TPR) repeat protein